MSVCAICGIGENNLQLTIVKVYTGRFAPIGPQIGDKRFD
jgi:hypothetical protein